ncbi:MAG: radical SAM protein [bacterium]
MITRLAGAVAAHPRLRALREFLTPPGYAGARLTPRKLANLYLSRWQEARGHTRLLSRPIKLTVEAANTCNLRCPACFTGASLQGRRRSHMTLELYRQQLDELGPYLFSLEFYNWGEPLLAKHIFTMIEEATQRGISTTVSTNFSFPFDAARAERLVTSGLQVLGVSLDGARQETYEQYRVRGNLAQVLANVRLVKEAKERLGATTPRLVWEFHVFAHNVGDVDAARAMAAELGMDISVTKGWTVGEEWNPLSEHRFFWDPVPPARCHFLWQDAVVHNDGGVAPCCGTFYAEDDVDRLATTPGDGAASFSAAWNGEKMRQARELYRNRSAPDAPRDHVCYDCPLTIIWEKWQQHQASGGTEPFEAGYGTNECFNYFWNRRPPGAVEPVVAVKR